MPRVGGCRILLCALVLAAALVATMISGYAAEAAGFGNPNRHANVPSAGRAVNTRQPMRLD